MNEVRTASQIITKIQKNHFQNAHNKWMQSMNRSLRKQCEYNEWLDNIYYNKKVQIFLHICFLFAIIGGGWILSELFDATITFLKK